MDKAEEDIEGLKKNAGSGNGDNKNLNLDMSGYVTSLDFQAAVNDLKQKNNSKVDTSDFDTEINQLKALINSLGSQGGEKVIVSSGPSISSGDLRDFRETAEKVRSLEERVKHVETHKANESDLDQVRSVQGDHSRAI